jgi:hypothetical protein
LIWSINSFKFRSAVLTVLELLSEVNILRKHPSGNFKRKGILLKRSWSMIVLRRSSGVKAMPQSPAGTPYATLRRSPRFPFDALVRLVVPSANAQPLWCRSTDICCDGIGVDLTKEGQLNRDERVSLQIPLSTRTPVDLQASVRYRNGLHCGCAFVELDEDQQGAIRTACEALAEKNKEARFVPERLLRAWVSWSSSIDERRLGIPAQPGVWLARMAIWFRSV